MFNHNFILLSTWLLIIIITLLLLLLLLLAQVTNNQVRPLRINYLASSHRGKSNLNIVALIVLSIKLV